MEGELLPGGPAGEADAAVLRGAVRDGEDQQQLLPDAQAGGAGVVGGGSSGGLQVRAQGAAADHALPEAEGLGGFGVVFHSGVERAERAAGGAAVPAPAEPEEGPAAAARVPDGAADAPADGVGVPARVVVRR